MNKKFLATIMAGAMVLGMTACGTKPTETTVAPTTTTTVEETTVETTAETTPAETTTAETTVAQPEYPAVSFSGSGAGLVTNVQATNITYEEVDMGEYYGDPSLAGMVAPVYKAQANQDIVITFMSNEALSIRSLDKTQSLDTILNGCTLTQDGNTYTLTIPANTFSAGDTCFITIKTDDFATDNSGDPISGSLITTNFVIV